MHNTRNAQSNSQRGTPTVSGVLNDGTMVEMLYDPDDERTLFCVSRDGEIRYEPGVIANGQRLVPYSPQNNLLSNGVVLFPSAPTEYGSEEELVTEIRAYLHRYVDVSPLFEKVAAYYVLLSWVYDAFSELPYLRLRGEPGSGKTRFLLTVGSLCYKPIFASGASTVSPLFRILDTMRGTLIVDEGDFRFSDEKAEVIKILNNGNAKGFPVLRSELTGKEYNPRAYHVFGPKLVATRGYFEDAALESRCLTEEMGQTRLREDVPISLGHRYQEEARLLRNKLLMFRFRNRGKRLPEERDVDRRLEPRLNQIFIPLMSVITDHTARADLLELAYQYNRELIADRGLDMQALVLEVIRDMLPSYPDRIPVKEIASWFKDRHGDDFERITPKSIGSLLRRKLLLKTQKSHGAYAIPLSERAKLERLFERYGINPSQPASEAATESLSLTG